MQLVRDVLANGIMITGFVFVMMVVIEYVNVLTRGRWQQRLAHLRIGQSAVCGFLGATPGCLGAYAVTSLYMHRIVTLGAVVAAMIATSGDEAFVMLALFPEKAFLLFGILLALGIVGGVVSDALFKFRRTRPTGHLAHYEPSHAEDAACVPFSRRQLFKQWRECSPHRGWLTLVLILFVAGVIGGKLGHNHPSTGAAEHDPGIHVELHGVALEPHAAEGVGDTHGSHDEQDCEDTHGWDWVRGTVLLLGLVGLAIVLTVPDHFLDEHLWNHIARVHVWRIFLWTVGALIATHLITRYVDVGAMVTSHRLPLLLVACLIGLIPESGPHLIFVTLYAEGSIPFSVLLASCIVQDGHGMIPMLSHSRRAFFAVKAINFIIGLGVGVLCLLLGW